MSKGTSGFCQLPCLRLAWERCRPGPGLGSPADVSRSPSSSSRTKWPDTCDVSAALAGHFVRDQALQHLSLSDDHLLSTTIVIASPEGAKQSPQPARLLRRSAPRNDRLPESK